MAGNKGSDQRQMNSCHVEWLFVYLLRRLKRLVLSVLFKFIFNVLALYEFIMLITSHIRFVFYIHKCDSLEITLVGNF